LLAVFLLHIITGFSLAKDNCQAKGRRYAVSRSALGPRSWPARTMPFTGGAVSVFLLLHLATMRLTDQAASMSDRVSQVLSNPLLALLYAAGIAALGLHVSHGFWSMLQSLGCNHPRWNTVLKGLGWLTALLITGVFAAVIISHGAVSLPQLFL
jgi:succinate dehydrogenase / fumarate reductase cytochrome b subunit